MRRLLFTLVLVSLLLVMLAAPALAFHHRTVPARQCAASEMAANNPQAREALFNLGAVHQGAQAFPIGKAQGAERSQAAAHCAGNQP